MSEEPVIFVGGPLDGQRQVLPALGREVLVPGCGRYAPMLGGDVFNDPFRVETCEHVYKPRLDRLGRRLGPGGFTALDYQGKRT